MHSAYELGFKPYRWLQIAKEFHIAACALVEQFIAGQQYMTSLPRVMNISELDDRMSKYASMYSVPFINMGYSLEVLAKSKILYDTRPTTDKELLWRTRCPADNKFHGHDIGWLFEKAIFPIKSEHRDFIDYLSNMTSWGKYPVTEEHRNDIEEINGKRIYKAYPFTHPSKLAFPEHQIEKYKAIYTAAHDVLYQSLPQTTEKDGSIRYSLD